MSDSQHRARDHVRFLHLLWALPIAVLVQFTAFVAARIAWCGFGSCSSPSPMVWETLASLILGTVLSAGVLLAAPWTKSVRLRLWGSLALSAAAAFATFVALVMEIR